MAVVCPAARILAAFVARNGRRTTLSLTTAISFALRAAAPHPTAAEELVTMRSKSYSKAP
jgi:hypothetical protein